MDKTLAISLEKLKKLGDRDNKELPNMEKYVKDEISALLDAEAPIKEFFIKTYSTARAYINSILLELSGSVVEGATTARLFQVDKDLEIEADVMINLFTIPQELSDLLETVKDKHGFVRLPFYLWPADSADIYIDWAKRFLGRPENEQYSLEQMQQYISPFVIRVTVKDHCDPLPTSDILNYCREMFGMDSKDLPDPKITVSLTETTAAGEYEFKSQWDAARRVRFKFMPVMSFDSVPAVDLAFWPRHASDWIIRSRVWPPHDTIQSIADEGCQVVPRTSPGGDVHSEWRLSFSRPEATLAKLRSKEQGEAYYFFKMFFYRYLKCVESSETDGKTLFSYVIKTIMLWACEELHPKDPIWASLENSVQMLLFKLLCSLEVGLLSHYFLPEINLLERVGQDVQNQCIAVISRWISNILMTAPFDLPEKREIVNIYSITFSRVGAVFSALESDLFEMISKEARKGVEKLTKKH